MIGNLDCCARSRAWFRLVIEIVLSRIQSNQPLEHIDTLQCIDRQISLRNSPLIVRYWPPDILGTDSCRKRPQLVIRHALWRREIDHNCKELKTYQFWTAVGKSVLATNIFSNVEQSLTVGTSSAMLGMRGCTSLDFLHSFCLKNKRLPPTYLTKNIDYNLYYGLH